MALGAVTPQVIDPSGSVAPLPAALGPLKAFCVNVVGDSAYSAGGSALTAAALGLNKVVMCDAQIVTPIGTVSVIVPLIQADGSLKLKALAGAGTTPLIGLAESTTANQSAMVFQLQGFGY